MGGVVLSTNAASYSRSLQGMPVVPTNEVLRSPPTTERAIGTRHVGVPGIKATSLSPRREVSSRSRGLLAAGAPPPAAGVHAYQSPLQTHRLARASGASPVSLLTAAVSGSSSAGNVSATSSASAAPVRARSPVQSQSGRSALLPGRLSLPGPFQLRPASALPAPPAPPAAPA